MKILVVAILAMEESLVDIQSGKDEAADDVVRIGASQLLHGSYTVADQSTASYYLIFHPRHSHSKFLSYSSKDRLAPQCHCILLV